MAIPTSGNYNLYFSAIPGFAIGGGRLSDRVEASMDESGLYFE